MTPLRLTLVLALVACSPIACGGDDGDGAGDESILGELCGGPQPNCPDDESCVVQPVPTGSGMRGYCSPSCETDGDCTADYRGPGAPVCFSMNECTIVCTTPGATSDECPAGLTCLPTGGPTNVCAVEMGGGS